MVESAALASNRLGDPTRRELPIYLPPGWDAEGAAFPVVFLLTGFTGRGQKFLETHPWHKGVALRYDELVAAGSAPPAILVMPDCFTRMGGSQYVNSSFMGNYEDHLVRELVPFVDAHYPTLAGRRGVMGKSSGGFGAMRLSMRHADVFPAAASISGDCHFEYGYAAEFLAALRGLEAVGGDARAFLDGFYESPKLDGDGHAVINLLAMSACYSPNDDAPLGFDLPIEERTGRRRTDVWDRWLSFDPVTMIESHADAWRSLDWLHLECGKRDEFPPAVRLAHLARAPAGARGPPRVRGVRRRTLRDRRPLPRAAAADDRGARRLALIRSGTPQRLLVAASCRPR